jgi:hypothetical protein
MGFEAGFAGCVHVTRMRLIDDLFSSAKLAYIMGDWGWGIGAGMAYTASADVLQLKQLLVFYFDTFLILLAGWRGLTSRSCISASFRYSLYELRVPPTRVTHSNFGNYRLSALSSLDTVRLLNEKCTCQKGKTFNCLSLIIRVKPEIL